jgi:hypothetical protein
MRSRNQCRRGKAIIITHSECVPVVLGMKHAKLMCRIIPLQTLLSTLRVLIRRKKSCYCSGSEVQTISYPVTNVWSFIVAKAARRSNWPLRLNPLPFVLLSQTVETRQPIDGAHSTTDPPGRLAVLPSLKHSTGVRCCVSRPRLLKGYCYNTSCKCTYMFLQATMYVCVFSNSGRYKKLRSEINSLSKGSEFQQMALRSSC